MYTFNEAYPEACYNPFRSRCEALLPLVFKYIIPYLNRQDLIACNLINKDIYTLTCELLWRKPSFNQSSYTHNELYIFNRFIASLPNIKKHTLEKVEFLDLSSIQETLYERVDITFFQAIVSYCPNLTYLNLSDATYLTKNIVFASNLWSLPLLDTLILSNCSNITDEMLVILARSCPSVSILTLCHNSRLNGKGLAAFASECDSLHTVDVSYNRSMGDEGLVALAKFRHIHLKHLSLTGCINVTLTGLQSIARYCIHLESFSLADCSLDGFIPLACRHMAVLDLSRGPKPEVILSWINGVSFDSLVSLSVDFQALEISLKAPHLKTLTLTRVPRSFPSSILTQLPAQLQHLIIEREKPSNDFLDEVEEDTVLSIQRGFTIEQRVKSQMDQLNLSEW